MSAVDDLIARESATPAAAPASISPTDALIAREGSMQAPAPQLPNFAGAGRGGQGGPTAVQNSQRTSPTVASTLAASGLPLPKMIGYLLGGKDPAIANQPVNVGTPSDLGSSAVALGDSLANSIGGVIKPVEYAVRRAVGQSPEDATQGSNNGVGAFFENPVSKFVNGATQLVTGANPHIEQGSAYQGEASQRVMQFVSQNMDKGAAWISQKTGLPKADVLNMMNTAAVAAVPAASKLADGLVPKLSSAADTVRQWNSELTTDPQSASAAAPLRGAPAAAPLDPNAPQLPTMQGGGAATTRIQQLPALDGQSSSRGPFPQYKTTSKVGDAGIGEQQARAEIIKSVLGEDAGVRTGALTGNEGTLRSEHTLAKNADQSPSAQVMATQLANEQQGLARYAQERVASTGADANLATPEARGDRLNSAFFGEGSLDDYFRQAKQQIYQNARDVAGDRPIGTAHIESLLAGPQFQGTIELRGHASAVSGASRLIDLARTTGFNDPVTGELLAPGSVAAWDAVRKSLNQNWTPDLAPTIRDLNGAIDADIAAAGGKELYRTGEQLHALQKTVMGSPGIGKIFGQADLNGIKEGTPLGKMEGTLNNLPLDQWRHIDDTLDRLSRGQLLNAPDGIPPIPASVQTAAAQARAELHGALAREVYNAGAGKAGVWNQNSVNKALNGPVGTKIISTFDPSEVKAYQHLNAAGQFMPGVHSYEGAALQAQRLASQPGLVEKYGEGAARMAGHLVLPGIGGEALGMGAKKLSGKLSIERMNRDASALADGLQRNSANGYVEPPKVPSFNRALASMLSKNK